MSAWLYDPLADLAFQSDDPPGTSPLRASRLTRFVFVPTSHGFSRMTVKANGYAFGCLEDPVRYVPLSAPVPVPAALAATLDTEWAQVAVARGALVQGPNGGAR